MRWARGHASVSAPGTSAYLVNRRTVLECLAVIALPVSLHAAESGAQVQRVAVIYDPRYVPSRRFAGTLARYGAEPFDAAEDLVRLWRGALSAYWRGAGTRIAGLTTFSDFVIARSCARQAGLASIGAPRSERHGTGTRSFQLTSWLFGSC